MKTNIHHQFESTMVADLKNFTWDEELELYEDFTTQLCWLTWLSAETFLHNDCMIGQTWFMKGTSASALIQHAEEVYKSEAIAQNSIIEFGTDDNEHWWAHEVPFYGEVQMDRIEEHGFVEWDIHFNDCWQGPFNSKSECIKHLEECIAEERAEAQEQQSNA